MEASRASGGIAVTLATKIRQARLLAEMTQRQLADAVGVEPMTVSKWERMAQRPMDVHVALVAERTGQSLVWFYTPDDEPDPVAA